MTEKFVKECRELFDLGLFLNPDNDIAKEVLNDSLIWMPKSKYEFEQNPILDLIKNYNCPTFDIGMIGLFEEEEILYNDNYIVFGFENSGNYLSIKKNDNTIIIVDPYYEFLEECCDSPESFLNNLIKVGSANIQHLSNKEKNIVVKKIVEETNGNLSFYLEAMGAEKI